MTDAQIAELAGRQFNRLGWWQLREGGATERAVRHRIERGRLVIVEDGVLAVAPVLDDDWGRWMGATLTSRDSVLSHVSALAAYGTWDRPRSFETVTRPGSGGPRRFGGVLAYRSETLTGEVGELRGIAIVNFGRALIDVAPHVGPGLLARALREGVRSKRASLHEIADCLGRYKGRRGTRAVGEAVARYSGLPLERARSGAEIRAIEVLRDAGVELPRLNHKVAGIEADLVWPGKRLIIEIDGSPFHQDVGEDARKTAVWQGAGWRVERVPSEVVYESPSTLITLALTANVRRPVA